VSFSANPYAMMELITAPPKEVWALVDQRVRDYWTARGRGAVDVYCSGCGAQDVSKGRVTISTPIIEARQHFDKHIMASHGRTAEGMHDWNWMV